MAGRMALMSAAMAFGTLYLFRNYYEADLAKAQTMSLTVLAAFQWFNAWNCRSENKSIFRMNPFSNKFLAGATALVVCLQLFAIYAPAMQRYLKTVPLDLSDWTVILSVAASIALVEEMRKLFNAVRKHFAK